VTKGITRVGVIRGGNRRCQPIFFLKKNWRAFSHRPLRWRWLNKVEDRAPKAWGVFNAAVSCPSGSGRSPATNDIWCILGMKMLYLARPSTGIVNAYLQKLPTDCAKSVSCQTDSSARNQFLTFSIFSITFGNCSPLLISGSH